MLVDTSIRVEGFIGNQTPSGGFAACDIAICTIEKANILVNRLIESDTILGELGLVVVDELHMVSDPSRGYLIELILSKINYLAAKRRSSSQSLNNTTTTNTVNTTTTTMDDEGRDETLIQLIGMSATLPNLRSLADWLQATLYVTDFRPIALVERLKYEARLYDADASVCPDEEIRVDARIEHADLDLMFHLVRETIAQRLGVLIFCPTKARCEAVAENIARIIHGRYMSSSCSSFFLFFVCRF